MYFKVIERLLETVSIPVALKISYYFSSLGQMIQRLSNSGVAGLVLFNRFFSPDIDIDKLAVKPSFVLSTPGDLAIAWTTHRSSIICLKEASNEHNAQRHRSNGPQFPIIHIRIQ